MSSRHPLQPLWRPLAVGVLALAMQSSSRAQLDRPEQERLFQLNEEVHVSIEAGDWSRCLSLLDHSAALAHRGWMQTSITWFGLRMRCEARLMQGHGQPVTAAVVGELAAPGLLHLARVPHGVERRTGARMVLLHGKWMLMGDFGLRDEAEAEERKVVQALLEAVKIGQDAAAREDLDRWANSLYGQHALLPQIQSHLRWIGERFGPEHRAALLLRRAVSFAHRSADRGAEALAVMDEAATLAQRHHPADVDLQMFIAGERAPALAANGLWLEARDEFIALRDWMLRRVPPEHGNLMRMNYHLASIANVLGDHDQAESFADAAQRHAQASALPNDRVEVKVADLHRAEARLLRGVPGAVDEVRRELERNSPVDGGTGAPAFGLAKLAHRTGDAALLDWSQDFLQRHAHLRLQPLQPTRALVEIAAAWSVKERDPAQARSLLERALVRSLSERDPGVSVQSAFAMARQLSGGQPDVAVWWFKRGANALQALRQRGRLAQDDSMHRATLADHEADLREFIALLIDEGRYLEARDALRVLREEELHDFTRRSRKRAAEARASALALSPQERQFETALAPLVGRMVAEQPLADARARPAPLETRGMGWLDDPASEAVLNRTQGDLHALLGSLSLRVQPGAGDAPCGRTTAVTSGVRCAPETSAGQPSGRDLPTTGLARLQYFVREQHLDILVTTARGWHRRRVPIVRNELHRRVHAWRAKLLNPATDALSGAREFHDLLIKPVQGHLGGIRQLHISLDGALRVLPLAALHDGQRYLVQRYGLVMDDGIQVSAGPPAATGKALSSPPDQVAHSRSHAAASAKAGNLQLAAFGRTTPDAEHAALPGVDAELNTLASLAQLRRQPGSSVRVLKDQDFTAQTLHDTLVAAPRVVHIASHFHLAAAEEESSYLLLGDGQRLPLARLAQMPWKQVRLVLLSACDSAVSESPRQGREYNGLAGVLRQAGVGSVLASLWPIADASTASFMGEFYRPWAATGAGRSGADLDVRWLAQAQRRWLARHPSGAYAHPYHWAAFVWWETASGTRPAR